MIGDDLVNDVGGAQRCGIKGVQVRTGKYRSEACLSANASPLEVVSERSLVPFFSLY